MTPHEQLDRRGRDLARFVTFVVDLLIVQVALAALERPSASTTLASLGSGVVLWLTSRGPRPRAARELGVPPGLAIDLAALSVPFAVEGFVSHLGPADCPPAAAQPATSPLRAARSQGGLSPATVGRARPT